MLETGYNVKKKALLANIHIQEVKKERKLEVNFSIEEKVAINGEIQQEIDDSNETVIFEILEKYSKTSTDVDVKPEIVTVKEEDKRRKTRKTRSSSKIKYYSSSEESATNDKPHKKIKSEDPEPGQCQHCQKRYTSKFQLAKHIKASHLKPRDFECEFSNCGRFFQTKQHLEQHVKNRHQPKRKTHQCTSCKKSFLNQYQLKTHKDTVHLKLNKFKCKFCHIVYRNFLNLHQHCVKCHDYDLYLEKKKKQKSDE